MEIVRLPAGEPAPIDTDCIVIDAVGGGRFNLTGSLLDREESISLVGTLCESREDAEAQGLAWAEEHGVARLYVTRDTSEQK